MYSKPRLAFKWIQYFIRASNSRGHGVHSPFVFEFVREVLNDQKSYYAYEKIENIKKNLLQDERRVAVQDFGAGSNQNKDATKKISDIAAGSLSSQKFGRLLFRLVNYYRAGTMVEMGSSLGISTAYLACANPLSRVFTMEGSPEIADFAEKIFHQLGLSNITQVTGKFEEEMGNLIASIPPADLVFIDGNHRKKPVLDYFEGFLEKMSPASMIVIHDIHWSFEMEEAWVVIQNHPRVKMSIDIFSAGLIFFREEFRVKQKFTIRF
jgi:predicted O-methyltransferase YrrM